MQATPYLVPASCTARAIALEMQECKSPVSIGFEGGLTGRHSMGLSNATFYENGRFFWDERAATLEDQVLMPIQDSVEMGTNLDQLREELSATEFYPVLFNEAYGSSEITDDKIASSLAQFVRSMTSYQSKFDAARVAGPVGSAAYRAELTPLERQGSNLFHGAGRCSTCHGSDAQIADRPHNIGLDADNSVDEGVVNGQFKVPSLRNIAVRERYMHDGRFSTLEEVIDFYSTGIQDNPNLDVGLQVGGGNPIRFNFTQNEKNALIAFLATLTDNTLINSELFSDPFVELAGDFDGSGLVDEADFEYLQRDSLSGVYFLEWQRNLGRSWEDLAVSAGISAVPEPSTAILAAAALLAIPALRISHRHRLQGADSELRRTGFHPGRPCELHFLRTLKLEKHAENSGCIFRLAPRNRRVAIKYIYIGDPRRLVPRGESGCELPPTAPHAGARRRR